MSKEFNQDMKKYLCNFYTKHYSWGIKHDSPIESRIEMRSTIQKFMSAGTLPNNWVLDIGSGPQSVERLNGFMDYTIVTLDFADIPHDHLLKREGRILHVRGDGNRLPFMDNSFGMIVSNHAIDFMGLRALYEAVRVLEPNGVVILNLHHPSLLNNASPNQQVKDFWRFFKENDMLFSDEAEIIQTLSNLGLRDIKVSERQDFLKVDTWWSVEAVKRNNL